LYDKAISGGLNLNESLSTLKDFLMRILVLLVFLINAISCFGAITLGGDATTGDSFTFLVHKGQMSGGLFFIAANEALAGNKYAVAIAGAGNKKFIALVPEKIKINSLGSQDNPLYGAKISDMYVSGTTPNLVVDGSTKVSVLEGVKNGSNIDSVSLLQTVDLKGSNSVVVNSILKVAAGDESMLAATTGSGTFGDTGSGIALTIVKSSSEEIEEKGEKRTIITRVLDTVDAATGTSEGNKALALTGATTAIAVDNDATINSNVIDIHYSSILKRYYIALDLTSGASATDKIRAVAIGRLSGAILNLDSIVVDGAISGTDQIVASEGAAVVAAISKVRTMSTTTHLDYLIVAGGNGTSGNTVYSLPLVNRSRVSNFKSETDTAQGSLAKADQTPTDYFNSSNAFMARSFVTPASSSSDLLTDSSDASKVGAGVLPIGASDSIADMFVVKDAVFVSISDDSGSNEPGLWQSQAIFDNEGKIVNWTAWQKVAAANGKVFSAGIESESGNFTFVTENGSGVAKTVKRTVWSNPDGNGLLGGTTSDGSNGLLSLMSAQLPQSEGGVQDYSIFKSTGLAGSFNILCATGLRNVLLAKTRNSSGSVVGDYSTSSVSSSDGSMPTAVAGTNFVSIANGALKNIGSITTSEIATNGSDFWLVAGGVNGLAILTDGSGEGWTSTISDFTGMSGSFKEIGNFSFVRKIVSNSNFLYVLTSTGLYRAALTSAGVLANTVSFTTLAEVSEKNSPNGTAFFDLLISGDLCLLATSLGLYRTGNSQSISSSTSPDDVNWTQVTVPDGLQPILKLIPTSSNLEESGFSTKGQVNVLSAYVGYQLAKLNRLYVNLSGSVDDDTVRVVPDRFFSTETSYFVNFGDFRSSYFTNGASFFSTRAADVAGAAALTILPAKLRSGHYFVDASSKNIEAGLADFYQVGNLSIVPYLGSMIFNGDFGFKVNE
jgi:hypothetical protein